MKKVIFFSKRVKKKVDREKEVIRRERGVSGIIYGLRCAQVLFKTKFQSYNSIIKDYGIWGEGEGENSPP